ncbi:MAG TPA: hypothetical protein VK963_01425, partial [Candidatus Saccharimonadales bacterium]|nr:hypothetical protein [Candidatus Saccharimonadales bacterium]
QPYRPDGSGPRVQAGEEEVTAFATGLRANTAVTWCAGPVASECFLMADQNTDPQGRSVFRFIVPGTTAPTDATVLVRYTASAQVAAQAPFTIVPNTNASCPEGAPNCTPSEDCDEDCRRGLAECSGPEAATLCPDGF